MQLLRTMYVPERQCQEQGVGVELTAMDKLRVSEVLAGAHVDLDPMYGARAIVKLYSKHLKHPPLNGSPLDTIRY